MVVGDVRRFFDIEGCGRAGAAEPMLDVTVLWTHGDVWRETMPDEWTGAQSDDRPRATTLRVSAKMMRAATT